MNREQNAAAPSGNAEHMPSNLKDAGPFGRFSQAASDFFAKPRFFGFCIAIILVWGASYFVIHNTEEWHLLIHTITGIITFLIVALLQNSETRADAAAQVKLNAIAVALAQLMVAQPKDSVDLSDAVRELSHAVGLEAVDPA